MYDVRMKKSDRSNRILTWISRLCAALKKICSYNFINTLQLAKSSIAYAASNLSYLGH